MKNHINIFLLTLLAILSYSCSNNPNKKIKKNTNEKLTANLENSNQIFYVSNIYTDKELGEIFFEKTENDIFQISKGKQNISSLLLDKERNSLTRTIHGFS